MFVARYPFRQNASVAPSQPVERVGRDMTVPVPRRNEFGAVGHDGQRRRVLRSLDDRVQCFEARRVGPMGVLEQHDQGLRSREGGYALDKQRNGQKLPALRRHVGFRVSVGRQGQQRGKQRGRVRPVAEFSSEVRLQLVQALRRGIAGAYSHRRLELENERLECRVDLVRRTLIAENLTIVGGERFGEFDQDSALAEPRFTRNQNHLAFAGPGLAPAVGEKADFVGAADEFGERARVQRLEAAFLMHLATHVPDRDGLGKSLQRVPPCVFQVEGAAGKPFRRVVYDEGARRREALKPRGEIRGRARDGAAFAHRLALHVADDDRPACDPRPCRQPRAVDFDGCDRRQCRGGRADRHFRLGLVRVGPTEKRKHAVAQQFCDMAVVTLDGTRHRVVIPRKDVAQPLRVQALGKLGRSHQVAEHHRHLAAVRRIVRGGRRCRVFAGRLFRRGANRLRFRAQGGQQFPPVPER